MNGRGAVNQIQLKVKPDVALDQLAAKLKSRSMIFIRRFSASPPGNKSKDRFWEPSPSSRASSTFFFSSSSRWQASGFWRSFR